MKKVRYKKTKSLSICCNAIVKYKEIEDKEAGTLSQKPYCSKCKKFPAMKQEDIAKIRKWLDDGGFKLPK